MDQTVTEEEIGAFGTFGCEGAVATDNAGEAMIETLTETPLREEIVNQIWDRNFGANSTTNENSFLLGSLA